MPINFQELFGSTIFSQRLSSDCPFIVAAMFTGDARHYAERLEQSLRKLPPDFAIYQVPTVHYSISRKGASNLAFSKPNFIHSVLNVFSKPVLYLDVDVVVEQHPAKIYEFRDAHIDFACYNWLNDCNNDCYRPITIVVNGTTSKNRFYRFSHAIDLFDPTQLIISGACQYYSREATPLLQAWLNNIHSFPNTTDDELLDYTYNISLPENDLKSFWLGKEYCRCGWWIMTKPIINHPHLPGSHPPNRFGSERFRSQGLKKRQSQSLLPRDCLIDSIEKFVLRPETEGAFRIVDKFSGELWVDAQKQNTAGHTLKLGELGSLVKGFVLEESVKIRRNSRCPCGSGLRYKHCHGAFLAT